ncbi:hypothetical protein [Nocardia seriolae]|uniref:Uncharacterized protein n=1 Tax=Nocardia seriolae TaxID=37332 RepID=A0A0B8NMZ4_9NOCA|nr:hypothetical protein [Nocardia seriolae]APA99842.1 hypothetical protein NS506_05805 [Nocardia seriolae]MTJ64538.1 hypothetical protein [Nocardia seriolae]MTJ74576.1 hypothetical protein [Nocardia seriolae]MTJ89382.1 hypothetical protein [Nocardia seriolae]MTK33358.1 hypothetical protein [Nocardia seriolae]
MVTKSRYSGERSFITELARELSRAGRRSGRRLTRIGGAAANQTVAEVQDLLAESGNLLVGAVRAKADDLGVRVRRL